MYKITFWRRATNSENGGDYQSPVGSYTYRGLSRSKAIVEAKQQHMKNKKIPYDDYDVV